MAYNHGKAERKWKLWKEKEEKILRDSGVAEDTIEAIRLYDRRAFNSDRRYYERVQETGTYLDTIAASTDQAEPKTVQDFLDHIENQELYHVLITVDRLTLQIVLMKIQGYSTHEIARYLKITEKAIYRRMDRLKEKVKKIFEQFMIITKQGVITNSTLLIILEKIKLLSKPVFKNFISNKVQKDVWITVFMQLFLVALDKIIFRD